MNVDETIVCPYCGHNNGETNRITNNNSVFECVKCSKKFNYSQNTMYFTEQDCELNNEKHDWYDFKTETEVKDGKMIKKTVFTKCSKCLKIKNK